MVLETALSKVNPFDLWNLLVEEIAGTAFYFVLASYLMLAIMCAKFRMPNQTFLVLGIVYGLILSPYFNVLLIIVVYVMGLIASWSYSKFIGRQ